MLPDILSIADQHALIVNNKTRHREEAECKCPFCYEDSKPPKKRRYYLSLNTKDQVFKCWFCGESGGVLRFISLLEGVTEEEVRSRFRKRKVEHPAERLTRRQRKLIGEKVEPNWATMKKRDPAYYILTMNWIWSEWNAFVKTQVEQAFFLLLLGIRFGKYSEYIEEIKKLEKVIEFPLLKEVLNIYSCAKRPVWTERIEALIRLEKSSVSPESRNVQAEKGEMKYVEQNYLNRSSYEGPRAALYT